MCSCSSTSPLRKLAGLTLAAVAIMLSALTSSCTTANDTQPNAVFVTTTVTTKQPGGAGSTTVPTETPKLSGLCPDPLVVQLDGPFDMWSLPWTAMESIDGTAINGSYSALMVHPIDRTPTGIRLELRHALPADRTVAQVLRDDRTVHLGTVSTDRGIGDRAVAPLAYLAAPWLHDDRIVWWNTTAANAPGSNDVLSLAELTLDPAVTVTGTINDPVIAYLVGSSLVGRKQLTDQPGTIQFGQFLADPTGWLAGTGARRWQFLTETGWSPYPHAAATNPSLVAPLKACFEALVPILQQAVVEVAKEPERMVANLVEIATRSGQALSPELIMSNLRAAIDNGLLNNVDGETVAEVTPARIEQALRADSTSRRARGLTAPSVSKVRQEAKAMIADFTTNDLSVPSGQS
jgi:hypothetical protein